VELLVGLGVLLEQVLVGIHPDLHVNREDHHFRTRGLPTPMPKPRLLTLYTIQRLTSDTRWWTGLKGACSEGEHRMTRRRPAPLDYDRAASNPIWCTCAQYD
jgi:hypothetical protein